MMPTNLIEWASLIAFIITTPIFVWFFAKHYKKKK